MNNSTFWIAVAEDDRRRARRSDGRVRRAGRRPAPEHPVLDVLVGVLTLLVLVAVAVRR